MENYDDMRKLMEQLLPIIYPNLYPNADTDTASESFAPISHITRELFTTLGDVVTVKQLMTLQRWKSFCVSSFLKAFSSHEMYLRYVMFACNIEMKLSENVFDRILKVWALVINYIVLTLKHTGVNYCELCIDVFIVFYKRNLKKSFFRQGGFKRLAEYIQKEYLSIASYLRKDSNYSNTPAENRELFLTNAVKKFCKTVPFDFGTKVHDDIMKNVEIQKLANDVLSIKKIKLPSLPSSKELEARLRDNEQKKVVGTDKTEAKPTTLSKLETPTDEYQYKTSPNDSVYKTPTDDAKLETLADYYKLKTSVDDSIRMVSENDSKRKMLMSSLNLETLVVDDYKRETHVDDSVYTTPLDDSKRLTPTGALKHKTSTVALNSETQTDGHKTEFPAVDLICKTPADNTVCKTPADDSIYKTPADDSICDSIYKTSAADSICDSIYKTPAADSICDSIHKTPAGHTIYKMPAGHTIYKMPAGHTIYKTPAGDSGYKTLTKDSKHKPSAEESKHVTPVGVLKFPMTKLKHRSLNYQAIDLVKDKVNIDWYSNIIRMITIYNNNKLPNCNNLNKQFLEKTRNILEHLKVTITNLIEILDEYDEERNF